MIAPRQKADTPSTNREHGSRANRPLIADSVVHLRLQPRNTLDRQLRNRIIVANTLVWILIIAALGFLLL
jgi:hypothetical protein